MSQFEEPIVEIKTADVKQLEVSGITTLVSSYDPTQSIRIAWRAECTRPTRPWLISDIERGLVAITDEINSRDVIPKSLLIRLEQAGWHTATLEAISEYTSHQLERTLAAAALKSA